MKKHLATMICAGLMTMVMAGCGYSHPFGSDFDYFAGGPNRAFLMQIAWNRNLCADPNRVVVLGEDIRSQAFPWHEGMTLADVMAKARWKNSTRGQLISSIPIETFFRFAMIGIWRNAEGRIEPLSGQSNSVSQLEKVRLHRGDIVVVLEKRISF